MAGERDGRRTALGYWNERGNWTVLAPLDFLRELVAAYRRRSALANRS